MFMQSMPKDYKFAEIEPKWQSKWEEMKIYHYDWNDSTREPYSIDTPPPYPSGELHMGNVLNWTYFDIVARFKRMQGYNVLFPQGWDCHGLGIEIQVEKANDIRKRDLPPEQFRNMCMTLVEKYISMMKEGILKLGSSIDWSTEYRTMDSNYWRCTQLSFIQLYQSGYMYQGTHPVNWCPRDETAIADAEVDRIKKEGTLYFIKFPLANSEHLLIATSRPEFIPACVAVKVNPKDARYSKYVGCKIIVPLSNREVPIIADDAVDMAFGTGAVQICTYGDKDDVKTVIKHKLSVIRLISENGQVTAAGGKYAGLYLSKARVAVVADLSEAGLLERSEKIQQEVGVCERCKTTVEVLERKQWFMKTMMLSKAVEQQANEISWYPDYMKNRLIDWAKSLDWDWVISRQRLFATPIPVWYCRDCGEIFVAKPEWVPIDPKLESPRGGSVCLKCGGNDFKGEQDVMDTWMDSSITCAIHAGWPDRSDWKRLFPASIHPSGTDIIRTWAYYLMVRHIALFDERPFNSVLINGMVLGADGRKMSKSLKNYAAAPEALAKNGADAVRQWAAGGGATGSDIPYRVQDVEYGKRFLNKLWNVSVFANKLLEDYSSNLASNVELQLLDKWIISKTESLTKRVTELFEKCQFNLAVEDIRNFTWHIFCDYYIEAIKDRLYRPEIHGINSRLVAQYTLYTVLYRLLQLFAPIAPHITEEIYQYMYLNNEGHSSIQISKWPEFNPTLVNAEVERQGDLIIAVLGEIRNDKAQRKLSLNAPIKNVTIYAGNAELAEILKKGTLDIVSTLKIENFKVTAEKNLQGRQVASTEVYIQAEY